MLRTIFKAILIAVIVAACTYGFGFLLVLTNFSLAVSIGELLKTVAPGVGIVAGLWYAVNGGWNWSH